MCAGIGCARLRFEFLTVVLSIMCIIGIRYAENDDTGVRSVMRLVAEPDRDDDDDDDTALLDVAEPLRGNSSEGDSEALQEAPDSTVDGLQWAIQQLQPRGKIPGVLRPATTSGVGGVGTETHTGCNTIPMLVAARSAPVTERTPDAVLQSWRGGRVKHGAVI